MIKTKNILLTFFLFVNSFSFAQNISENFSEGMKEFNSANYLKSVEIFSDILKNEDLNDELFASTNYYLAESYFNLKNFQEAAARHEFIVNNLKLNNLREKSLFRLGNIYFDANEIDKSRERFLTLLSDYPQSDYVGSAYYLIGEIFTRQNKLDEAIIFFENVVQTRKNIRFIDYAIYTLATIYEKLGDYTSAVGYYDQLLSFHKESELAPFAQIRIGISYFKLQEYDSTILELSNPKITNLPLEKRAEALFLLGNSHYRVSEFQNAIKIYQDLLSRYPLSIYERKARYSVAWSYFQLKKFNDAFNHFHSLSSGEDSIAVKSAFWKAEAKRYSGAEDEAMALHNDFIKLFPTSELAYNSQFNIGAIYFLSKNLNLAETYLNIAANTSDEELKSKAFLFLGAINLERKNYQVAEKNFNDVLNLELIDEQTKYRAMLGSAVANFHLNALDKSLSILQRLENESPFFESSKVSFYIAEIYMLKEEYNFALKYYSTVNTEELDFLAKVLYGRGYAYYNLKDYENASYQFLDFIAKFPKHEKINEVRLRVADGFFVDKKYDSAIRVYQELLDSRQKISNRDYIQFQLALSHFRAGRTERAIQELNEIKNKFRGSAYFDNALYLIGWIHFQKRDYNSAIEYYRDVLAFSKNDRTISTALYSIGDAYFNLGIHDSAIVYYSKIMERFPNSPNVFDAINGIQYSYVAKGESLKAIQLIDNFVLRNINLPFADQLFLKKGEIFYSELDYVRAKQGYKEFISYFPKSIYLADAYYWIGKSAENLGEFEEAIINFNIVFDRFPNSEIAQAAVVELGKIFNEQKRFDDAIKLFDRAVAKFQESNRRAEIIFMKGETFINKGDISNAYDTFDEVLLYHDGGLFADKARLELGKLELNSKRYDRAETFLRELIQRRTDDIGAEAQFLIGEIFFNQSKWNEAITAYVRVLNLFGSYDEWVARAYLKLGDSYLKKNDKRKAQEMFRTVLSKHKGDEFGIEAQKKLREIR